MVAADDVAGADGRTGAGGGDAGANVGAGGGMVVAGGTNDPAMDGRSASSTASSGVPSIF